MGDFSDNTAYQMAKGSLRGLNQKILDTKNHLKSAGGDGLSTTEPSGGAVATVRLSIQKV